MLLGNTRKFYWISGQIHSEQGFWFCDKNSLEACVALCTSFVLFRTEYSTAILFYCLIKTRFSGILKQFKNLLIISLRVSVKRGLEVGTGVGVGVVFFSFLSSRSFLKPNSDFSQFARNGNLVLKISSSLPPFWGMKEMKWGGAHLLSTSPQTIRVTF